MPKKISEDFGKKAKSESTLEKKYDDEQRQVNKAKRKIATQMSDTLQIVYIFNMVTSFIITLLLGFNLLGFKLDPVTYMISTITFVQVSLH